jgi:hypothetical protein
MSRPGRIFTQFINPELLALYGCKLSDSQLLAQAVRLARIALMVSEDGVVLPRSYLVEVGIIDALLEYLRRASDVGLVQISSESPASLEFLVKKRREYRTQVELFPGYGEETSAIDLDSSLWTPRTRSSSGEIGAAWCEELGDEGLWQEILEQGARPLLDRPLARIENAIEAVPYRLDGRWVWRPRSRLRWKC